jgi:hypothetical protein
MLSFAVNMMRFEIIANSVIERPSYIFVSDGLMVLDTPISLEMHIQEYSSSSLLSRITLYREAKYREVLILHG